MNIYDLVIVSGLHRLRKRWSLLKMRRKKKEMKRFILIKMMQMKKMMSLIGGQRSNAITTQTIPIHFHQPIHSEGGAPTQTRALLVQADIVQGDQEVPEGQEGYLERGASLFVSAIQLANMCVYTRSQID